MIRAILEDAPFDGDAYRFMQRGVMTYASFPLAEIDLSKLILIKEALKTYDQQDQFRWIFRSSGFLPVVGEGDLYVKVWNPTYFRRDTILKGIEAGFYDEETTPALVGLISHKGVCRGYIMRRCRYHGKIEAPFHALIRARTLQTGLFFLQYSRYHIMRWRKQYTLIDLEAIYPLAELPRTVADGKRFEDPNYARFVNRLFTEKFPSSAIQITDLVGHTSAEVLQPGSLPRGLRLPQRKARAAWKHMTAWVRERQGLRNHDLSRIET